ncbi:MAG: FHA domain-containing protein [Gammaproteobacteria bacterium]|nr:FHA domain-containing protein [Gammaproteobacteria bacterium]
MSLAAIELCDAALVMSRGSDLVAAGPGYAALVDGRLVFGDPARSVLRASPRLAQRAYWAALSESTLAVPLADAASGADLAARQLAGLWQARADATAAILVVPPGWSESQLGLLLGIAGEIGMPVAGLVDIAVAASRRPYPDRALWDVVAGLQTAWITRIGQEGGARLGARISVERFGVETIERGCAEFIARAFVDSSRFDPLHQASSEQRLFDRLDGWLAAAMRQETIALALEHGGHRYEARLSAAALRAEVARLCEPLTRQLRTLLSPREPSVLQVHHRLAQLPGVIEALMMLPASAVVELEPGAAARGALRLRGAPADTHVLATALPFDQPAASPDALPAAAAGVAPTHLVHGSRAWRLGPVPLQVGAEMSEGEYGLKLTGQGVSRRHCTIRLEDGRMVLHDQSRYGTALNGHRVESLAVLQAGDVIAIGQPPQELVLVAEAAHAP